MRMTVQNAERMTHLYIPHRKVSNQQSQSHSTMRNQEE